MVLNSERIGTLALRLVVGLLLMGGARVSSAGGKWSVVSLPRNPGEVLAPTALVTDLFGNLYVASSGDGVARIEKRDVQGNWSILAATGDAPSQVHDPS